MTFFSPRSAVVRRTCSVVCRILVAMWRYVSLSDGSGLRPAWTCQVNAWADGPMAIADFCRARPCTNHSPPAAAATPTAMPADGPRSCVMTASLMIAVATTACPAWRCSISPSVMVITVVGGRRVSG